MAASQVPGYQGAAAHSFNDTMFKWCPWKGTQQEATWVSPSYLQPHCTLSKAAPMKPGLPEEHNPQGMAPAREHIPRGNVGALRPFSVTIPFAVHVGQVPGK